MTVHLHQYRDATLGQTWPARITLQIRQLGSGGACHACGFQHDPVWQVGVVRVRLPGRRAEDRDQTWMELHLCRDCMMELGRLAAQLPQEVREDG